MGEADLEKIKELLEELNGKVLIKKKAEILTSLLHHYEASSFFFTERNDIVDTNNFIQIVLKEALLEAQDNCNRKKKQMVTLKYNAIFLLNAVLRNISNNIEILEQHPDILKNIIVLLKIPSIKEKESLTKELSDSILTIVDTIEFHTIEDSVFCELWKISWDYFVTFPLNYQATWNSIKIITKLLGNLKNTTLSLDLVNELKATLQNFFQNVKKHKNETWPPRVYFSVLSFLIVFMDQFGLLFREKLLDELFSLSDFFIPKLKVAPDEDRELEWTFVDRLTSLAIPDCRNFILTDGRIFSVAFRVLEDLIRDLVAKSEFLAGFQLLPNKVALFAKILVIIDQEASDFRVKEEPGPSKRTKTSSLFELFFNDYLNQQSAVHPANMLLILEESVAKWGHRLSLSKINFITKIVLNLDNKIQKENLGPYCSVVTALIRGGILGNSAKVKSEAAVTNPMQDPRITIKSLWKMAVSAAHNPSASNSAIELMIELIRKFKKVLAPEEDDQLIDTICSVLSAHPSKKSLDLMSLLLTKLEFDEVKPFSGAENKESGIATWKFRCQLVEHLVIKVPEDISLQLFQLSSYHPQAELRKYSDLTGNSLENVLKQCYLIEEIKQEESNQIDEQLGACINHEMVEYISNFLQDQFAQERVDDFVFFTSVMSYCCRLEGTIKITGNSEIMTIVEPVLQTANEWLTSVLQGGEATLLQNLDPGLGAKFISSSNRQHIERISSDYPILFSKFPTHRIPLPNMKQFLHDSIDRIHKIGDFPVPVQSRIKGESGEHRFHQKTTIPFSIFLANTLTRTIEESIEFLPDLVTLLEIAREVLKKQHLDRIVNKAEQIIEEDRQDDSPNETILKRKMSFAAAYPHLQLISHLAVVHFQTNSNIYEPECQIILDALNTHSFSLIKQALIRYCLEKPSQLGMDEDLFKIVRKVPSFRELVIELFPEYLDHENEYKLIKLSYRTWKENKNEGLSKFKDLTKGDQKQGRYMLKILKGILVTEQEINVHQLLAIMGIVISAKGDDEIRKSILTDLLSRLENIHEAEQIICEAIDPLKIPENEICNGVVYKWLNGGELEKIGFALTKIFWKQLKSSLNSTTILQLEEKGIFLYDYILLFWDALPSMRKEISEILSVFDQSREVSVRRGKYSLEEMKKLTKEYSLLRVMDPIIGEAGELSDALRVLDYFEGNKVELSQSQGISQEFSSSSIPYIQDLIKKERNLNHQEKFYYKMLFRCSRTMPNLLNNLLPFFEANHEELRVMLKYVANLQTSDEMSPRLIRVLAETVDAIGLNNLALSQELGESFLSLGNALLLGGYTDHAYAVANIAFDLFLKEKRNLAAFGGPLPTDEGLWQLLGAIYIKTENCQALDSLPRYMQDHISIQLLRAINSCHWLQVAHSPTASEEQKIKAKWYCGFDSETSLKYLKNLIYGKWEDGYPKRLDTHQKRLFALIKNQNQCSNLLASKIREMYLNELENCTTIPADLCNQLYDLEIVTKHQITPSLLESLSLERLSLLTWKMYRHCKFIGGPDATLTYSDYNDHFQVTANLLLSKLKEKKAYMAALSILPILYSVVVDKTGALRLAIKECEIHVEMGNHQLAENKLYSLSRDINLQGEDSEVNVDEIDIGIEVICLLSKIQAEHSSKNVEQAMIPLKALNNCNMTNDRAAQHVFSIALRQLQETEAFMQSPMIKLRKEARDSHRRELQHMRTLGASSVEDQRRQRILGKEYSCENEELSRLEKKHEKAACFAVQSAVELLEFICNSLTKTDPIREEIKNKTLRVLFPLIDLIFRYENNPDVVTIFKSNISSLPFSVWLPAVPHIMPHCFRQSPLSDTINLLIVQMLIAYPFHTVPTLLSYKYGQNKPCPAKAGQVDSLLEKAIRSERSLETVVKDLKEAHRIYREFVWLPIKKENLAKEFVSTYVKGKEKYKISDSCCIISKLQLLRKVPIPTVTQPVGKAKDYRREQFILWGHIDPYCEKADGNSSPKILRVKGSNGINYKMVWKDGESLRQDSLVQDLFSVMSDILETDQPLRTYNVVPLDSHSGIIEFCGGTQSIKDILIGPDSREGLHRTIYPDEEVHLVRKKMNQIQLAERTIISVKKFKELCEEITPVFRHHFYRTFPQVHEWNRMIKKYTKSLAQWSIVTYVVGLGDRHGSNVLFEPSTSNFVHIDLGMILEFSRRMLPIPELVPFRLTRDLLDPILVQGIKGNLAYEVADALDKIRKNKDVILGVASVFLRETVSNFNDTTDDKQKSFVMATAFGRLQAKLNGADVSISPTSPMDQTKRLLAEATDLENLAKLFGGWLAII